MVGTGVWNGGLSRGVIVLAALLVAVSSPIRAQQNNQTLRTLSLSEALNLAEQSSEAVGIARAGVQRARGEQLQARSGYFPQLSGSATYTRTLKSQFSALQSSASDNSSTTSCRAFQPDPNLPIGDRVDSLESALRCLSNENPFASFRNLPFGREHQYNFGLSLTQTIFDRRLAGQTHAAAAGRQGAEIGLEAQRAEAIVDVTAAYYDAVLGDRLLAIAESTLAQSERTLHDVEIAREVGNQPEFELLRARVARDNLRPIVIQRRTQRDLAYLRLKQLLDLPFDVSLALSTELGDTTNVPLPEYARELAADQDTSAANRAPVRQAEQAVEAAEGRRTVASGQQIPALRLSSTYAKIGFPDQTFDFGTPFVSDWTIALRMDVPLFTGGRIRGEKMAAEAGVMEARLQLDQVRETAALETRNLLATLESARSQWEASTGTVEQATRAYEIAEVRYREGISTQTELADARLLLVQAQANRALAARDLQVVRMQVLLIHHLPFSPIPAAPLPARAAGVTSSSESITQ